jgi:hypothetical protein
LVPVVLAIFKHIGGSEDEAQHRLVVLDSGGNGAEFAPLPLVICLMSCLKPANDNWDLPEFPHLHPDFNEDPIDFDLDYAYQLTGPVADDVPLEVLQRFVDRVADAIGPKV